MLTLLPLLGGRLTIELALLLVLFSLKEDDEDEDDEVDEVDLSEDLRPFEVFRFNA